jgi:hypothetical protein
MTLTKVGFLPGKLDIKMNLLVRNVLLRTKLKLHLGFISVKANRTEIYEYFLKLNAKLPEERREKEQQEDWKS